MTSHVLFIDPPHVWAVEDEFFEGFGVNLSLPCIYDLSTWLHQHAIGQSALPFGVDGFYELVFVVACEDIVR